MTRKLPTISTRRKPFPVKLSDEERMMLETARGILKVSMGEIIRYATFTVYLPSVLKKDRTTKQPSARE